MSLTIGKQLRQAREQKLLTLDAVAEATHIRLHYLQALEADDFSVMPSAAQARGFLRNYSGFLGLDLETAVSEVQHSRPAQSGDISGPLPEVEILPPPPEPIPAPPARETASGLASVITPTRATRTASASAPTLPSRSRRVPASETGTTGEDEEVPASSASQKEERGIPGGVANLEATGASTESIVEMEPVPQPQSGAGKGVLARIRSLIPKRLSRKSEPPGAKAEPKQAATQPAIPEPVAAAEATPLPPAGPEAPSGEIIETAEKIFAEIGAQLRRRRELLSLTPEEVERHTHVRVPSIQALEAGDFNQLSSAVQTRGMLANYAAFLDLDADVLLLRYADALQASHRARHPSVLGQARQPVPVRPNVPPLRSFMAGDVIFGLAVVVLMVGLVVWGLNRVFAVPAQVVALPTAPSISEVLAGAGAPTLVQQVTLIPVADTPLTPEESTTTPEAALEEVQIVDPNVAVSLTVVAIERTFMRVEVDGEEVFNGRVVPGTAYSYEATDSVQILTGNGAALRVTYNGRDMGLLGSYGQVAAFVYTADAVVTPLPVFTPTSTGTPFMTPTPTTTPSPAPATRTPVTPSATPAS